MPLNPAPSSLFRYYINSAINKLLPHTCILCNKLTQQTIDLCQACENELPRIELACLRCGVPIATPTICVDKKLCGQCIQHPPPYNTTFALYHYEEPIDKLITGIKFSGKLVYAKVLGELFAKNILLSLTEDNKPDYLIPMPLHQKRLCERGFNQALELARPIAKYLQIPIDFQSCIRSRNTIAQTLIPAETRYNNIKNAFSISKKFFARHVAILDDVVTTGNTVTELSKVLKQQGIENISIWCCARTNSHKMHQ